MEVNRYFDYSVISTFSYWIIILISSLLLPPKEDIFCPWLKIGSQFVPPALTKPLLITNSKFSKSWDLFFFCFVSWNATVIGKIPPRPPPSQLHPKIKILHNFEGKLKILHNLQRGQLSKSSEEKRPQDVLQSVLQKPTQAKEDECCCKHDDVCLFIPKINLIFDFKLTLNYIECITYGSLSYIPCHLLIPILLSTQKRWVV